MQRGIKQVIGGFFKRSQGHDRFLHLFDSKTRHSQHLSFKSTLHATLHPYVMQSASSI